MRAVYQVLQCGSSMLATMHGNSMKDVRRHLNSGSPEKEGIQYRPEDFFERYIFLERKNGVCRIREILNESGKRLFPEAKNNVD